MIKFAKRPRLENEREKQVKEKQVKEIKPPEELFVEEYAVRGSEKFCGAHSSRQGLIGSRLSNSSWRTSDPDEEQVFVYKFSHVEIIRKKLEIVIEKHEREQFK